MLDSSPVAAGGPRSLLDVDAIDDHARQLSRHSGRRVDAEIAPGREPGSSEVRYRVAESKPWFAYAQWSNTGTKDTTRSRPRFGFVHNQLLGIDDTLRLDYVSGNFDEVHGFFGSYEVPIAFDKRLRLLAAGSYSKYDASSVGLSFANFKGRQAEGGLDLIYQVFQWKQLFVDVLGGARWVHAKVDNKLVGTTGKTDFFLPQFGVRLERDTLDTTLRFGTTVDFNLSGVADTSTKDIVLLGRANGDKNFARLLWGGTFSAYLEALIHRAAWADVSTPASSTLAHEGFLSFRGQHSFGQRVAPQFEMVSGGLYTVRGYNQSLVAADTVVMTTAEYRLHLPRLLFPEPLPREAPVLGSFRTAPQYVYGRPDWDLVLRAFFDIAWLKDADAFAFEPDGSKMMGAGAGIELSFLRNFSVRYDFGVALDRVGGRANLHSVRHYVVVSLLY
jgi:hemolysin activation/secretion protein